MLAEFRQMAHEAMGLLRELLEEIRELRRELKAHNHGR